MGHSSGLAVSGFRHTLLAGLLCATSIGAAHAEYPNKPITMIMPYAAGGSPDAYGRLFADKLQQRIGQPVIVENRPGANGTIGAAVAAKARPDGYTIFYGTTSNISSATGFFKSLSYDPAKDLVPITVVAEAYYMLVAPASEKDTSLPDYLEKIKQSPKDFPVAGAAGTAEVISKMLQSTTTGLDYTYVRYASSTNMITDLLGGRLGGVMSPVAGAAQLVKAGKLHGMGVVAPQRLPTIPDVPTMNEALSESDLDLGVWTGYFVPAGTPQAAIDTLYGHMAEVLKDPAIIEISELGGSVMHMTPAEAKEYIEKDRARWPGLLKAAGIEPT